MNISDMVVKSPKISDRSLILMMAMEMEKMKDEIESLKNKNNPLRRLSSNIASIENFRVKQSNLDIS